ncbi:Uncharacterised protein [Mycobacteroides abscessus]|nr:Uncharacterised protein [Mycobacteroides abscessus]
MQKFHRAPRGFIGKTNITDTAFFNFILQGGQGFFEICHGTVFCRFSIAITQLAKEIGWALRPVQLIQVNIIRLQA